MRFMIIEYFPQGPAPIYSRFAQRGRLMPDGLTYVDSWVSEGGDRCFQVMECDDRMLLDRWMAAWSDIVEFEVIPVLDTAEARRRFAPEK